MNLYGINYTVCNIGSVYSASNAHDITSMNMSAECRFNSDGNWYTSIPSYIYHIDTNYKYPSVDSNGAVLNAYTGWGTSYYYPAISTYVKFYYKIND